MTASTAFAAIPPSDSADRHPPGLFHLFFVEMWERFSFYGMRALLVLYMIKGFLKYGDDQAYAVYGAYGALVYATPFIGGMLADRVLGNRLAVIWGGLLMAAGHLMMTVETEAGFFTALSLLVVGNGFFKPNISAMVGALYKGSHAARDAGFTIFYMGINLGAALAPVLCGYLGEEKGWHYGFGLATVGMLVGVATFVAPRGLARILILLTAAATAIGTVVVTKDDSIQLLITVPFLAALVLAAIVSAVQLGRGGLDPSVGQVPAGSRRWARTASYVGTLLAVPVVVLLLKRDTIAGVVLSILGGAALIYILVEAIRSTKVERQRLFVVVILMFFSLLFWAFFEQAGSSVNLFTDRNVDRVVDDTPVVPGQSYDDVVVTQEFVGETIDGKTWHLQDVEAAQKVHEADPSEGVVSFTATADNATLAVGGSEIRTSVFQAVNPAFILLFGLVFSWLWTFLSRRHMEPNTPVKFALGLMQLGLGFGVFWYGATNADAHGIVALQWIMLGYLLQTTGELCLSPVGLSMVTRLSPTRLVSTIMGAWFLATAFSHFLAAFIAKLSGIKEEAGADGAVTPLPIETVGIYGELFKGIALIAMAAGVVALLISPLLKKWMHEGRDHNGLWVEESVNTTGS
ncbi:MAG: peptide MFS transporter [Planctomycetota bacterium]|nr:peptide MFS transporter [Planctomycetota bacterium]MDA1106074.1 peptide MFS transporter [Planctomycetota bacterium]